MARVSYTDVIGKPDSNEGINLSFDETNTVKCAQGITAMLVWFEKTTGRRLATSNSDIHMIVPDEATREERDQQPKEELFAKHDAQPKKAVRRKRRNKAEMAADKLAEAPSNVVNLTNGQDEAPPETPALLEELPEPVATPSQDDVRGAAETYLKNAGTDGPGNFQKLLAHYEANKISELDDAGRTAVFGKLMETPSG